MNKWLKIFPFAVLISGFFCFFHAMLLAWLSSNWIVIFDFNSLGEGWFELIITFLALPFIFWYVHDELSERSLVDKCGGW